MKTPTLLIASAFLVVGGIPLAEAQQGPRSGPGRHQVDIPPAPPPYVQHYGARARGTRACSFQSYGVVCSSSARTCVTPVGGTAKHTVCTDGRVNPATHHAFKGIVAASERQRDQAQREAERELRERDRRRREADEAARRARARGAAYERRCRADGGVELFRWASGCNIP